MKRWWYEYDWWKEWDWICVINNDIHYGEIQKVDRYFFGLIDNHSVVVVGYK